MKKKDLLALLFLAGLVFLASRALFHPGFFKTIDDITTVRIIYLLKELNRGLWKNNFPVRWSAELSHGFGYPLYLFYSPLVYYVGALTMKIVGLSHIVATKAVYFVPLLTGPFLFYLAARQKLKIKPALLAATLYCFFPFRGYDSYIRGGVGEAWAMAFLPGVFLGLFLLEKKNKYGSIIFSFFLTLIIISHNISALMIIGLIFLYGLLFLKKSRQFWLYFLLTFGLTTFFWLPAVYYLPIVKVGYSNQNSGQILNFLVPFKSIFKFSFPFKSESRFSGIFIYLILFSLSLWLIEFKKKRTTQDKRFLFFSCLNLGLLLLITKPFVFFWQLTMPITRLIQFPWRLFVLLSFSLPFLAGLSLERLKNNLYKLIFSLIMIVFSFSFLTSFKPKTYTTYYEYRAEDSGPCATSWGEEYLPIWVKECRFYPADDSLEIKTQENDFADAEINILKNKHIDIEANINIHESNPVFLVINRHYFPGWKVFISGQKVKLDYQFSKWGFFRTQLNPGQYDVRIVWQKTKIMWLADIISALSLGMLIFLIFYPKYKHE